MIIVIIFLCDLLSFVFPYLGTFIVAKTKIFSVALILLNKYLTVILFKSLNTLCCISRVEYAQIRRYWVWGGVYLGAEPVSLKIILGP